MTHMPFSGSRVHAQATEVEQSAATERSAAAPVHVRELLALQAAGGNASVGRLLRSATDAADVTLAPSLTARIQDRHGAGERLRADVTHRFGAALGEPLTDVRIHRDSEAAALADSVQARAFTAGSDIFFAAGAYQPDTAAGAQLLAHELAHTAQAPAAVDDGLLVSAPGDRAETAADHAAHQAMRGLPASVDAAGSAFIHRSPADGGATTVEPGVAQTQALAGQLANRLQAEHQLALTEYQQVQAALTALSGQSERTGQDQARMAALTTHRTRLENMLQGYEADFRVLADPTSTPATLQQVIARRGTTASTGLVTETSSMGGVLSESNLSWSTTQSRSALASGTAVTTTDSSSATYTPTSATWAQSTTTTATTGTESVSSSSSTSRTVGLAEGQLSYGGTAKSGGEQSDTATGYSASSGTTKTVKVGAGAGGGAYSSSVESSDQVGDTRYTRSSGTSYTAGGGKFGQTRTTDNTVGTVDDKGELVRGLSTGTSRERGVIAGADGYGGYGGLGGRADATLAKGVKIGMSTGLDGRFTVNVAEVPNTPGTYQIALTISLGANLGASTSISRGSDVKGSLSVSASGAVTAQYVHVLPEAEVQRYLAALRDIRSAPLSGTYHELGILRTAVTDGEQTAIGMLRGVQAGMLGDPAAAARLAEGDSVTITEAARGGADLSAGARGASLGGGVSAATSLAWTVARVGGKVLLTGTPASETGWKASGSAPLGAASMGYGTEHKNSSSHTFRFVLDPGDARYATLFRQIVGSAGQAELAAVAAAHPELVDARSATTGTDTSGKVTAGLGPLSLLFSDTHTRTSTTDADRLGQLTVTEAGTGGGGVELGFGGVPLLQYSETGAVITKVGPGDVAEGDVSTSTSESDWAATWSALAEHPLDTIKGLFTGSTKLAQDTDVVGMTLSDADYARIAITAGNSSAWTQALLDAGASVLNDLQDWRACRSRIVAARDGKQVAAALADFVQGGGSRRATVVRVVVRGPGSAQGGSRYEWPSELASQRSMYESLVTGDPLGPIDAAQNAGDYEKAGRLAVEAKTKLDALVEAMEAHESAFLDGAAFGEMLNAVAARRAELVGRARLGADRVPPGEVHAAATAAQAQAHLDGLLASLQGFQRVQTRVFAEVRAEQAKVDDWFDKPDVVFIFRKLNELKNSVYPIWWNTLEEAADAAKAAGQGAPGTPKPDLDTWKLLNSITVNGR